MIVSARKFTCLLIHIKIDVILFDTSIVFGVSPASRPRRRLDCIRCCTAQVIMKNWFLNGFLLISASEGVSKSAGIPTSGERLLR